jgi:glycosyltransferase involved in cell wall biosynthesis
MANLATFEEPRVEDELSAVPEGLVTAIIPTFNRPELVRRAILSALAQGYRNLEVVVIIDGSDERTRQVVESIREARLRIVELGIHLGAAQARNVGVKLARGEWVTFLDDDDEWVPCKIEMQIGIARTSSAVHPVVCSRVTVRSSNLDWISPARVYSGAEPMSEYLFCRRAFVDGANYVQTSTLMMQRRLMLKLPFRAHLKRHQDWDWLLRAQAEPGVEFQMIPAALTIFNVEDGRTSIGRSLDWEASRAWAQEMRPVFTRRAYSFFLANECVSRAVKSSAGGAAYAGLAWEFFSRGQPTPRSVLSLAGFLCIPESIRNFIRRTVRHFRVNAHRGQTRR